MYKIRSVRIDNFWHRFNASCTFNEDVNIIIGRNGTGKTTFMNILHSVLAVDLDGISTNDFESVSIELVKDKEILTVSIVKKDDDGDSLVVYYSFNGEKRCKVKLFSPESRRRSVGFQRRAREESEEIRTTLSELVSLSSLSVYRLRSGQDYEIRDRHGVRAISPVDYRLSELMQGLTHYQLELSYKASSIAAELQRDVLTSILYDEEESSQDDLPLEFDKKIGGCPVYC